MAIRCNLAVLMAERELKATKVSSDTGISRTTITALRDNRFKGIQISTLDTLCRYLRVTPAQFFVYDPNPTDEHWYYTAGRKNHGN